MSTKYFIYHKSAGNLEVISESKFNDLLMDYFTSADWTFCKRQVGSNNVIYDFRIGKDMILIGLINEVASND